MMNTYETQKAVSFLALLIVGVPGNVLILVTFAQITYSDHHLLPADVILTNLAFVNLLHVLARGMPQTLFSFGVRNMFNTLGCQLIVFIFRVSRSLSICLTFLLSAFQSVTIAPADSKLSSFKQTLAKNNLYFIIFFWLLSGTTNFAFIYSTSQTNLTVYRFTVNLDYCFVQFPGKESYESNGFMYLIRDLIIVILMALCSIYILFVLYRHSKSIKGIRSSDRTQSVSAEARAAKTVVTLVVLYVILFGIDNMIWVYTLLVPQNAVVASDMRHLISSLYAAVFPLVIIFFNKKVSSKLPCT
ncbi:olfactory receptor class A-like protein 1 [Protopterus annectens]|uniref:olfactory receptor class A-like protein 1 n=1 Tax=Protopterus annectens TaxID=7888 RepID=UPI001CFBE09B|nr:olfactory receptor class A-like protein 1 [Protopterus annectens]